MTKTLTEQWRDGTLPEGYYYTKVTNMVDKEKIMIDYYIPELHHFELMPSQYVKEVIVAAPSCDEYKRLQERLEIATKALNKYQEAINRFKKDPMNNIIMLAHQLIYDIDIDSKKALKEMEGVK